MIESIEPIVIEAAAAICLAVHLWSVNISSAIPLMGILLAWKANRHNSVTLGQESRLLGWYGLAMLLVGTLAGLTLAGVMWVAGDRGMFEVLPRFTYKIKWALWELLFYVLCILGYIALSPNVPEHRRGRRWLRGVFAVLAAANLLYHFPPLFIVIAQVADHPDLVSESVSAAEFRQWLTRGHVVALTCHFGLASLAVSGMVTMDRLSRRPTDVEGGPGVIGAIRMAGVVALVATAAQVVVGLWTLVSLGPLAQQRLMGSDLIGTTAFILSLLGTFALLHRLAHTSYAACSTTYVRRTLMLMMVIVLLMSVTLRRADRPWQPQASAGPQSFVTQLPKELGSWGIDHIPRRPTPTSRT